MRPRALMIFADITGRTHYKFLSLALAAPARDAERDYCRGWKSTEFGLVVMKNSSCDCYFDIHFLFQQLKWEDLMGMREVVCGWKSKLWMNLNPDIID